jgi:hypothetical protein
VSYSRTQWEVFTITISTAAIPPQPPYHICCDTYHSRIIYTPLYFYHNKRHTLCHGIFISFKLLVSQQHFPWAVWFIKGSLRNFPADYCNNLNCYRVQSTPLHQYQQCMVHQFGHHQHIFELSSVYSVPTPRVLTTVIIKQQVPVKHWLISWGTLMIWQVHLKCCKSTGLALHPRCLLFIVTTVRTPNPVFPNKDSTENFRIYKKF